MSDTSIVLPGQGPELARQPQSMVLEAVIIRADGTREELGAIAYWHRNPIIRLWHRWVRGVRGTFRPIPQR